VTRPSLALDHIVVSAERLEEGVAYVEDVLGVEMAPGGAHPQMGTHNRLLGLGHAYLEVIAIDPEGTAPDQGRWFDLDHFSGPPRLTNWVAQTPDLPAALAVAPNGSGLPTKLSRGDLTWQIALSPDGTLPFGGAFPGLIAWGDTAHPTTRLPDAGCRLAKVQITHPEPGALRDAVAAFASPFVDWVAQGPLGFRAEIDTPSGRKVLTS
jgi:hypothetical protein